MNGMNLSLSSHEFVRIKKRTDGLNPASHPPISVVSDVPNNSAFLFVSPQSVAEICPNPAAEEDFLALGCPKLQKVSFWSGSTPSLVVYSPEKSSIAVLNGSSSVSWINLATDVQFPLAHRRPTPEQFNATTQKAKRKSFFATLFNLSSETAAQTDVVASQNRHVIVDVRVLGMTWLRRNILAVVTNESVDVWDVSSGEPRWTGSLYGAMKWFVKVHKTSSIVVCADCRTAMVVTLNENNAPVCVRKIEMSTPRGEVPNVPAGHVGVVHLYDEPYLCQTSCSVVSETDQEVEAPAKCGVFLWPLATDVPPIVLKVPFFCNEMTKVCFQTVDNLLIIHNLKNRETFMCDILLPELSAMKMDITQRVDFVEDIADPNGGYATLEHVIKSPKPEDDDIDIYGPKFLFAGSRFCIDTENGACWELYIDFSTICLDFFNKSLLVRFLQRRENAKPHIIETVMSMLQSASPTCEMSSMLRDVVMINAANMGQAFLPDGLSPGSAMPIVPTRGGSPTLPDDDDHPLIRNRKARFFVELTQQDICENMYITFVNSKGNPSYYVGIFLEYIRLLSELRVPIQPFVFSLLIDLLVKDKMFFRVEQLIQFRVIEDSVIVANKMLELTDAFPNAFTLGVDMLKRLRQYGRVVEAYLRRNDALSALRTINGHPDVKFNLVNLIRCCNQSKDVCLQNTVYRFLVRNKRLSADITFTDFLNL